MEESAKPVVNIQGEAGKERLNVAFLLKCNVLGNLFVDINVFSNLFVPDIVRQDQPCTVFDCVLTLAMVPVSPSMSPMVLFGRMRLNTCSLS